MGEGLIQSEWKERDETEVYKLTDAIMHLHIKVYYNR